MQGRLSELVTTAALSDRELCSQSWVLSLASLQCLLGAVWMTMEHGTWQIYFVLYTAYKCEWKYTHTHHGHTKVHGTCVVRKNFMVSNFCIKQICLLVLFFMNFGSIFIYIYIPACAVHYTCAFEHACGSMMLVLYIDGLMELGCYKYK